MRANCHGVRCQESGGAGHNNLRSLSSSYVGRGRHWAACDRCVDNLGGDDALGGGVHWDSSGGGRLDTVSPCHGR